MRPVVLLSALWISSERSLCPPISAWYWKSPTLCRISLLRSLGTDLIMERGIHSRAHMSFSLLVAETNHSFARSAHVPHHDLHRTQKMSQPGHLDRRYCTAGGCSPLHSVHVAGARDHGGSHVAQATDPQIQDNHAALRWPFRGLKESQCASSSSTWPLTCMIHFFAGVFILSSPLMISPGCTCPGSCVGSVPP